MTKTNVGNRNTGNWNTGDWNTGDWNTGNRNSGPMNSGNSNTGDSNTGHMNTGDWNSGDWNTGNRNSGSGNSGNSNTGDSNTGHMNTGDWNTGDSNTGDWNSGSGNSGNSNTGSGNTGNWNSGNNNTGHFNTTNPETIRVFDVEIPKAEWEGCALPEFIFFQLTKWVGESEMSLLEKSDNPSYTVGRGFLKELGYKEAFKAAYADASAEDRAKVFNIPNFDADKFLEISGIDVRVDIEKEDKKAALIAKAEELLKQAREL